MLVKIFCLYKAEKSVIKVLKTKTFSNLQSSSVVSGGNLHTTWLCLIRLFQRETVLRRNNGLVCLKLGFRKQLASPLLLSSEKWFSQCM